jgi:perosamine synthetase
MRINNWRISEEEIFFIEKAIRNKLTGKYLNKFEDDLAKKFNRNYVVAVNSGTSALHAALYALGIKSGDEVIVPPLTFSATAFAAIYLGAKPVFADVDIETFNICPKSIKQKISKKTKAIITVSLFGLMPDMKEILKLKKKYKFMLLEDNAETIFSSYKNKISGTFGDMSIMSFQRSKHLTMGDGGAILTNSKKLFLKAKQFSVLGYRGLGKKKINENIKYKFQNPNYYRHQIVAPNYRMPEIIAAAGIAQIKKANYFLKKRVLIGNGYKKVARKYSWVIYQKTPKYYSHSYWTFAFYFKTKKISWWQFRKKFIELGGERFYSAWKLSYQEPALKNRFSKIVCKNAEILQKKLILLKTNFTDQKIIKSQIKIFDKTLLFFKSKYQLK